MSVDLHSHQQVAVDKMHNGCVLYGGVGVGKSITAMAYYVSKVCKGTYDDFGSMREPKRLIVITTAKKRDTLDWEKEAIAFGISHLPEASRPGTSITVDSWNNLYKYVGVKDAFFIFDEQRVVGYGAWSRAFIKIAKDNEWVLLSATPGDTWLDYIPVFIANGWYRHKTDFLDQHVIWTPRVKFPKVLRYQDVSTLVRRRNEVLVHMPYERHTIRHAVDIWCDYDEEAFDKAVKKRWHVYENRPLRDVSELFSVMRRIVNSDDTRLDAIQSLMSRHPKLIVFYNFDYELDLLRTLASPQPTKLETLRELGAELSSPSSTTSQSGSTTKKRGSEPTHHGQDSSKSQSTHPGNDPLKGTIWEDGFDEKTGLVDGTPSAEIGTNGKKSTQKAPGPSFLIAELCGFEFRGNLCKERLPCSRHEGLSSGGIYEEKSDSSFAIAEWNGHKHQEIPKTDRWVYLVQYRAGAEGWNCVETDAMCFFSQTYSYRDWWQAHGRIDRLNTPFTHLWYYSLVSRSIIDKAIRKALKAKKSFNERDLVL